jgi:hypothetical protein
LILTTATLLSFCTQSNKQEDLQEKFARKLDQTQEQIDNLGPVIQTIDFKQKATGEDLKTFEDGFIPWISVEDPNSELSNLIDADKIVIDHPIVTLFIDYPLNNPAIFEIKAVGEGFSRRELILKISEKYQEIYKLEESTAKTKTIPPDQREGMINRNETDGKYGVWGHDLSDLDLSQIEVHKDKKGEITLTLVVDS